jgi:8-oxo-dGTP pyrophosphatase MutT (NUDIX family)
MPHIHTDPGQVDHTVEVFVVEGSRVLLRKHDKYGIWLSVGGHLELDEDPTQAAVREVEEEVGLRVELVGGISAPDFGEPGYRELTPPVFLNRVSINETHDHVTYTYFGRRESGELKPERADDELRWFGRAELERNDVGIKRSVLYYAMAALAALGNADDE